VLLCSDPCWLTLFGFSDTLCSHMRSSALALIALVVVLQNSVAQSPGQRRFPRREPAIGKEIQNRAPNQAEARKLFGVIEQSILSLTLSSVSSHFAQQVFVNMSGAKAGIFQRTDSLHSTAVFLGRSSLAFEFSRFSDTGSTHTLQAA